MKLTADAAREPSQFEAVLRSPSATAGEKAMAMLALSFADHRSSADILFEESRSEDPIIERFALAALARMGPGHLDHDLAQKVSSRCVVLIESSSPEVRSSALAWVSGLPVDDVIELLAPLLDRCMFDQTGRDVASVLGAALRQCRDKHLIRAGDAAFDRFGAKNRVHVKEINEIRAGPPRN